MEGVDVAYFLIHSMEPQTNGAEAFDARERRSADNFVAAAQRAGVRRIVYLGGPVPADKRPSLHLSSRLAVEEALLAGAPEALALRASIVIGARSRSFRFLVRLVERIPVMVIPGWHSHRTAPIDGRDVISYLANAATSENVDGPLSLDIAGPEVLAYGEIIERIRDLMMLDRPALRIKLTVDACRQPGGRRDRGRGVRADRPADGGPEHRPAAARRPRAGAAGRPPALLRRGGRAGAARVGGGRGAGRLVTRASSTRSRTSGEASQ